MPATSVKDLHLAASMKDLEDKVSIIKDIKSKSTTQLISSAKRLFEEAEKSWLDRDEEKAYLLFMRYIELILELKKRSGFSNSEYKNLMLGANKAIAKAEELKESLKKRYLKKEDDLNCKVKNERNEVISAIHNKKVDVTASGNIMKSKEVSHLKDLPETSITSSKLFSLLTTNNSNIVLMDVRSETDYEESHIKHNQCISIPKEIITPGISAGKLEKLLPSDSLTVWNLRGEADLVVIIDWNSADDFKHNTSISTLIDAMTKWSQKCSLKKPPLILQGGYKDWMLKYPMHTTQALKLSFLNSNSKTSPTLADVSGIDYPNLDETLNETNMTLKENLGQPSSLFKKTSTSFPVISNSLSDSIDSRKTKSAPTFDRKAKPNINLKPSTANHKSRENGIAPHLHENKKFPTTLNNSSSNGHLREKVTNEDREKKVQLDSLIKEESLTKDCLELAREQLTKEQEFETLSLRREKEAEESQSVEIQKQLNVLMDKMKELSMQKVEKDAECKKVQEENEKMKKLIQGYKDKELLRYKENVVATEVEKRKLEEEVKRLREERKRKEAKKKLESKPESIPRNAISANSALKKHSAKDEIHTHNSEYTIPLSRQSSTDSTSRGLVRSHSSPNIAQMINQEESNQRKMPAFDRTLKPTTPTYQSTEVSRARIRNLNPVYGNCPATGLRNLGNTCFMNSVIQCLSNTIPLAEYFTSNKYLDDVNRDSRNSMAGEVADEFAVVIRHLWIGQYKSFSPKDFKNTVSKCLSVCIGNEQQDSHEFLVVLMEKLHADLNRKAVKNVPKLDSCNDENVFWQHHKNYNCSKISEIFEGLLKSTLTCLTCRKTSDSFEVFSCLSLPISSSRCSLRDCFQHFLKSEKISGEAAWDCPKCKQKKEAEKRLHICRLPDILVIQLKRFSYEGLWRRKLQTHVDFDITFDVPYERNSEESSRRYSLYGIVNHYGTLEGGHYTAFCNNSNKWYKYDDHEVSEISLSDIRTSAAYLLFYRASDLRSNL